MIAARLSPATVAASGRHSGRWAFGPTPRTVLLLAVGLALAIPGWVDSRALVLMAAWTCSFSRSPRSISGGYHSLSS